MVRNKKPYKVNVRRYCERNSSAGEPQEAYIEGGWSGVFVWGALKIHKPIVGVRLSTPSYLIIKCYVFDVSIYGKPRVCPSRKCLPVLILHVV